MIERLSFPRVCLLAVPAIFFSVFLGLSRFVAGDEGFYLLAAKLSLEGRAPYLDFFYPQMPGLPLLLGGWFACTGVSWISARIFFALCNTGCALLIAALVVRRGGGYAAACAALLAFFSADLVVAYFPVAKTYAPSVFFLLAALLVFESGKSKKLIFYCGVLAGLAVAMRLQFFAGALVLLLGNARTIRREGMQRALIFCCGLLLPLFPALILFLQAPDAFIFNNLGYHSLRNKVGLVGGMSQKLSSLEALFTAKTQLGAVSHQFSAILLLWAAALWHMRCEGKKPSLSVWISCTLFAVSLLPTPVYLQYFSVLVPFLLLEVFSEVKSIPPKSLRAALFLAAGAWFLCSVPRELLRYTRSGEFVSGVINQRQAADWKIRRMGEISAALDAVTEPGEYVVSTWPGYLVESHARIYPGLENHFGLSVAKKLAPPARRDFKILSENELRTILHLQSVKTVILGYRAGRIAGIKRLLRDTGYGLVFKKGSVGIFQILAKAEK